MKRYFSSARIVVNPGSKIGKVQRMHKKIYLVIFLIIAIAGAYVFTNEFLIKEPTVENIAVNPKGISFTTTTIEIVAEIHNPNLVGVDLEKITYDIYTLSGEDDWNFLAHGEQEDISIKAYGNSTVKMPMEIDNLNAIITTFDRLFGGSKTTMKVNGSAVIDLKLTSYELPFERVMTVPDSY